MNRVHKRGIAVLLIAAAFVPRESLARCAESASYKAEVEVMDCQPTSLNGVLLKVNLGSSVPVKVGAAAAYEWWPGKEALADPMAVFYESENKGVCARLKSSSKMIGILRKLCCDGGEPRCKFSSAQIFDLNE